MGLPCLIRQLCELAAGSDSYCSSVPASRAVVCSKLYRQLTFENYDDDRTRLSTLPLALVSALQGQWFVDRYACSHTHA